MKNILLLLTGIVSTALLAQEPCGHRLAEQQFIQANPHLVSQIKAAKLQAEQEAAAYQHQKASSVVKTIPIVFHILHENGTENISDRQVLDGLRVLNEDMRKTNADFSSVIADFTGIAADSEIEFKLAQKDPQGNCTNGINRYETALTNSADNNSKINQWPREKYLNVWVVKSIDVGGSGQGIVLGYSQYPSVANFSPQIDGIVIRHSALGTIETASNADGKTLTHEVGHWINLAHTWGNGEIGITAACNTDDGVSDTPNCIGNASGCNTASTTCGSLDNVQNFMNYAACTHMFTQGQADRMNAALNSNLSQRNNLWTAANLAATGTDGNDNLCVADFLVPSSVACVGDTFKVLDASYHGPTSWSWNATNAGSYSTQDPEMIFVTEGFSDISLAVTNASGNLSVNKQGVVRVIQPEGKAAPFNEDFESIAIPSLDWDVDNVEQDVITFESSALSGYSSSSSIYLNNTLNTSGNTDVLISPLFDLSNMSFAAVSFKTAFARKVITNVDKMNVYFSKDCGQTWTLKYIRPASTLFSADNQTGSFVPADDSEWKNHTFTMGANDLTDRMMFKIEFISGGGNNFYFDAFEVDGTFTTDIILSSPQDQSLIQDYSATLDWKAQATAVDAYEVQFDTDAGFNSPNLQQQTFNYIDNQHYNSDTEFDVNGLVKGTTYYWRVRYIQNGLPLAWSAPWSFMVDPSLSLPDVFASKNSLHVFPNPTKDFVTVALNTTGKELLSLDLFDFTGRHIENYFSDALVQKDQAFQFFVQELPAGMYYLRLSNQKGDQTTQKLLIHK